MIRPRITHHAGEEDDPQARVERRLPEAALCRTSRDVVVEPHELARIAVLKAEEERGDGRIDEVCDQEREAGSEPQPRPVAGSTSLGHELEQALGQERIAGRDQRDADHHHQGDAKGAELHAPPPARGRAPGLWNGGPAGAGPRHEISSMVTGTTCRSLEGLLDLSRVPRLRALPPGVVDVRAGLAQDKVLDPVGAGPSLGAGAAVQADAPRRGPVRLDLVHQRIQAVEVFGDFVAVLVETLRVVPDEALGARP